MRSGNDILVLTVCRSFWATEMSRRMFPRTLCAGGPGSDVVWWRNAWLFLCALRILVFRPPKLVIVGPAHKVAKWLLWLRHRGLFRGFKLVTHQMVCYWTGLAPYADRIIMYSSREVEIFTRETGKDGLYRFIPLPADGDFDLVPRPFGEACVFAGGLTRRDFDSVIEAVRGLPVRLKVRCGPSFRYAGPLPENVSIEPMVPLREFLHEMKDALLVVVPLAASDLPHGHTTVVQAMRLGKAVVTTRGASVSDYVTDGQDGLLVAAGDVAGYRAAIQRLFEDERLRRRIEEKALEKSLLFTYENFGRELAAVCEELLCERAGAK